MLWYFSELQKQTPQDIASSNDINTVTKHVTDWKSTKTEIWKLNFFMLSFSGGFVLDNLRRGISPDGLLHSGTLGPQSSTSSLPYDLLSWNQLIHDVSGKLVVCPGKSCQDLWKLEHVHHSCELLTPVRVMNLLMDKLLHPGGYCFFCSQSQDAGTFSFWRRIVNSLLWYHSWFAFTHSEIDSFVVALHPNIIDTQ